MLRMPRTGVSVTVVGALLIAGCAVPTDGGAQDIVQKWLRADGTDADVTWCNKGRGKALDHETGDSHSKYLCQHVLAVTGSEMELCYFIDFEQSKIVDMADGVRCEMQD